MTGDGGKGGEGGRKSDVIGGAEAESLDVSCLALTFFSSPRTLGGGGSSLATSIFSMTEKSLSQDKVAPIAVGRVIVAIILYSILPFSN